MNFDSELARGTVTRLFYRVMRTNGHMRAATKTLRRSTGDKSDQVFRTRDDQREPFS
jgi:hypothetical protein